MDSSIEVLNSELAKRYSAPVKPERKYVSMFRIDGKPILPPMMTPSKIAAMRKLREQAIEIEKYLEAKRQKKLKISAMCDENSPAKPPEHHGEVDAEIVTANTGSRDSKDSLLRLSNLMRNNYDGTNKCEQAKAIDGLQSDWRRAPLPESNNLERLQKLQKSETLIYDNFSHVSATPARDWDLEEPQPGNTQQLVDAFNQYNRHEQRKTLNLPLQNVMQIPSICVNPPTPLGDKQGFRNELQSETQQQALCNKSESSTDGDSTDSNNSVDVKPPPRRSATSPALTQQSPQSPSASSLSPQSSENGLVRSNSFTLEYPSKVLVEHMRKQKASAQKRSEQLSSAMRETVESKAKRVQKVQSRPKSSTPRVPNPKAPKSASRCDTAKSYGNSSNKSRPSPYDSKVKKATRAQSRQPKKISYTPKKAPTAQAACGLPKETPKDSDMTSSTSPQVLMNKNQCSPMARNLISEIEADHRQKLMNLMAQQVEEQKRLEQSFAEQKQELLSKLLRNMQIQSPMQPLKDQDVELCLTGTSLASTPRSQPTLKSPGSSVACNVAPLSTSRTESSATTSIATTLPHADFCTPRRRLFSNDSSCSSYGIRAPSGRRSKRPAPIAANRRDEQDQPVREHAATKINALARGFLVRRLFQTEQIQRIVQTIRDTLIFVINLHMETSENADEANTPANIKLKARLLQQLSSATRTLHLVFFQTTIKERMEIIARDRKRIKTKLITMNRKRL